MNNSLTGFLKGKITPNSCLMEYLYIKLVLVWYTYNINILILPFESTTFGHAMFLLIVGLYKEIVQKWQ